MEERKESNKGMILEVGDKEGQGVGSNSSNMGAEKSTSLKRGEVEEWAIEGMKDLIPTERKKGEMKGEMIDREKREGRIEEREEMIEEMTGETKGGRTGEDEAGTLF